MNAERGAQRLRAIAGVAATGTAALRLTLRPPQTRAAGIQAL
ncbi:MAG: hypothetical protein ABW002_09080 [Xanthomonas sp.]